MGVEAVNNDSTHTSQIRSSGLKEDKGSIFESQKGEAENPNEKHYIFKIEPKDKVNCKAHISNIDWSVDGRLICASFKGVNVAIVWNINTCQNIYEFNAADQNFGAINNAIFYNLNPDYIQISGDKAIIIKISKNLKVQVSENFNAPQVTEKSPTQVSSKNIKRKGTSNK